MTKQMSALRRHMIEDMKIRNMSPNSQKVYTYAVANFRVAQHGSGMPVPDWTRPLLCTVSGEEDAD